MNCASCGQVNLPSARFCHQCGAELSPPPEQVIEPAQLHDTPKGFVGRQRELGELRSALDHALSGQGRVVMLVGEPGIGKTQLAQELANQTQRLAGQVLWGWCYEGEGAPPYWPWVQALRSYVRNREPESLRPELGPGAADIAEVLADLRGLFPDLERPPTLEPEQARFRLFDSITTFLKNAAQARPLLLVLDDLHWADRSSLLLLEFLAREIHEAPLLVLGTYRDVAVARHHPLSQTLGSLVRSQGFSRVQLRGLDQNEVKALLETTAGFTVSNALANLVHSRTEGNPLFVRELVPLLGPEALEEGPEQLAGIPEGIRDAIGRRLNDLSDDCNQILTIASVTGRDFDFRLLRVLGDASSEGPLQDSVDEALAAHIIEEVPGSPDRYRFSHALVQETLTDELSTRRKALLHARIGEALEELYGVNAGAHAAELVHHFGEAEPALGSEKLARYSLLAGEQLLAAHAYEDALTYFQRGLDATPDQPIDAGSADLLFGLGRAKIASAGPATFQEAWDTLARVFDYQLESGNFSRAIEVLEYLPSRILGRVSGVTRALTTALNLVPADSHEAGRLLALFGFVLMDGLEPPNFEEGERALNQALAIARRDQDTVLETRTLWAIAAGLDAQGRYDQSLTWSLRAIDLARRSGNPQAEFAAQNVANNARFCSGELDGAKQHARAMIELVDQMRDRHSRARAFGPNQTQAYVRGEWDTCRQLSEQGLAASPRDYTHLVVRAQLEYELGDFAQGEVYLERLLETARSAQSFPQAFAFPAAVIPVTARISGGYARFDVATASAETALSLPSIRPAFAIIARVGLALMAVRQGDADVAAEQYRALLADRGTFLRWVFKSVDHILGLLAYTMRELDTAAGHLEEAANFCRQGCYRTELAWTCLDYAEALLQRNGPDDRARALTLLEEAFAVSDELGMLPLRDRVTARQEQAQSQPSRAPAYPDGLSHREVEVLRLIALGKTDREIAQDLVISARTVGSHVSNILNKTGAANRTEATAYATRQGLA